MFLSGVKFQNFSGLWLYGSMIPSSISTIAGRCDDWSNALSLCTSWVQETGRYVMGYVICFGFFCHTSPNRLRIIQFKNWKKNFTSINPLCWCKYSLEGVLFPFHHCQYSPLNLSSVGSFLPWHHQLRSPWFPRYLEKHHCNQNSVVVSRRRGEIGQARWGEERGEIDTILHWLSWD